MSLIRLIHGGLAASPIGSVSWDWSLDGWIVVSGILCGLSAALLGSFLVLRRLSLLGDAISHAVLPGIVAAYWLTGSASSLTMWIGAIIVGLFTVWLTEAFRGKGGIDEGASTGIVFTGLFAIGLVMVVRLADRVDLDLSCVLYGDIENVPLDLVPFLSWKIPRAVLISGVVLGVNLLVVGLFRRELQLTAFDPSLAASLGISPIGMHYLLASLVAITSVSSFESVGNILVVAMFVVPPSTAFLLTKRLSSMLWLSCLIALISALLGHLSAITLPRWFGFGSTSTAAMIAMVSGLFLLLAIFLSPQGGLITQIYRRWWLSTKILSEDVLAVLYRDQELARPSRSLIDLRKQLLASPWGFRWVLRRLQRRGFLVLRDSKPELTTLGLSEAQNLVRAHRLWEQYLAMEAGVESGRLHNQAESLEHFTNRGLRERLETETQRPSLDPHGRPIPPESRSQDK